MAFLRPVFFFFLILPLFLLCDRWWMWQLWIRGWLTKSGVLQIYRWAWAPGEGARGANESLLCAMELLKAERATSGGVSSRSRSSGPFRRKSSIIGSFSASRLWATLCARSIRFGVCTNLGFTIRLVGRNEWWNLFIWAVVDFGVEFDRQ